MKSAESLIMDLQHYFYSGQYGIAIAALNAFADSRLEEVAKMSENFQTYERVHCGTKIAEEIRALKASASASGGSK